MVSESTFAAVSLDEIITDDHRFKISTTGPPSPLVESIDRIGLINPPVLLEQDEKFVIVCGFKRITACEQLKIHRFHARILPADHTEKTCIRIAVADNVVMRELNVLEQARVIQLLDRIYADPARLCQAANQLGFTVNAALAEKLRAVSNLPAALQKALVAGNMALPVALQVMDAVTASTACRIAGLFGEIKLSLNRQREFVDGVIAISRREKIRVKDILEGQTFNKILDDPQTDKKVKSQKIRAFIKQKRYPEISKTEELFQQVVQSLNLEKGVQLIAPSHFEGTTYTIKIDFKGHEELVAKYGRLKAPIRSDALQSLWETIGLRSRKK